MVIAEIRIELKQGVADPEGQNTRKALEMLGFKGIKNVRSIKLFEIELELEASEARTACEDMCRKLLANPVIQKYSVKIK
ncbi:MAG: phosphoribosylformylglycinamidine synthase subunit PurS [Methanomassiliicoccales archaeon]|nr:MAG: phosphoribosylformylglycinamidine synthase subunit PurS [Methanomassiliicoccales archaeon]